MRLYVVVEGQTEEEFVLGVLGPYLDACGVFTSTILVTTRRDSRTGRKLYRGGGRWKDWHRELRRLVADQPGRDVRFTTLFDLYGLPSDFPELGVHGLLHDTARRAEKLEQAMQDAIGDSRLIPYLQRHEFEALVLADLDALQDLLDPADREGLESLRRSLGTAPPEDVDDGADTSPSKRLTANIPGYNKSLHGPLVVGSAGLPKLRAVCPRFHAWVSKLERLAEGHRP